VNLLGGFGVSIIEQELTGDPELPGFRIPVQGLFDI
jgi:hypothetical protein